MKINDVYFESDDARERILLETKGRGFDLLLVNGSVFKIIGNRGGYNKLI